ncbi:MAG: ABC transporter permease [Candidatus Omnitrophota bacterium]
MNTDNVIITNPIGVMSLAKREIIRFLSVATQTIVPPLISSALFMCIFGLAIGRRIDFGDINMTYLEFIIPGLMTMHLITSSYENTSSSLFIARWHNHIQEILLSPLSYFEMVLGLLAGGLARGVMVTLGIFLLSTWINPMSIAHPFLLIYFILMISCIFSCLGMLGALWAEDFNMLGMFNTYFIMPLVFVGGVFYPIKLIPQAFRFITTFDPIYYLVNGMRYSMTGLTEIPILYSVIFAFSVAVSVFFLTVYLFKIGYKLRT